MGVYSSGSVIDLGWFAGFSLILIASLIALQRRRLPSTTRSASSPSGISCRTPPSPQPCSRPASRCCAPATRASWCPGCAPASWSSWSGRQLFTLLENQTLTRTLEERVHARTAELTASRERFIALVQHSSDIVTMIDPHGVVGYQSASIPLMLRVRSGCG